MKTLLTKILVTMWVGVGSLFGYHASIEQVQTPTVTLGDYNPTGGGTYRLQSSISSTQTTLTLTSFKEPVSNIKYTMSYLNSTIEYATINPQGSTKEFVSFTGITQNSDGTALLTGVSRGLSPSYPFTASTTFQSSHSGQEIFILSNPPQLTNQYLNKNNSDFVAAGVYHGWGDPPYVVNAATSTTQLASVAYVNSMAFGTTFVLKALGGTGVTGFGVGGFVYDSGAGTALSGTTSPTVSNLISTSSRTSYFAGPILFDGSLTIRPSGVLIASSTNNVIASSTQYTENVGKVFATSTVQVNGYPLGLRTLMASTSGASVTSASATTTLQLLTIPANVVPANSILRITVQVHANMSVHAFCNWGIQFGNGNATSTYGYLGMDVNSAPIGAAGVIKTDIMATSTSAQMGIGIGDGVSATNGFAWGKAFSAETGFTLGSGSIHFVMPNISNYSLTGQTYIAFVAKLDSGTGGCWIDGVDVDLISQ